MKILLRTWAIFIVATRRLLSQWGLALATLMGLVAAIALTVSIPLYADAVYYRVFREELSDLTATDESTTHPPFAFMFQYIGAWEGQIEWEDVQLLDEYLSDQITFALGLPQQLLVRYYKTDKFRLFPQEDIAYADTKDPLAWVDFGSIDNVDNHITILEGSFPAVAASSSDSTVEVLISEALAVELGLQVGETYLTFNQREIDGVRQTTQIPVRIAGIWRASDPTNVFWFYKPNTFETLLLVPPETFLGRISPYMEDEIYGALWYLVMDGSNVHATDAGPLLARIIAVQQRTTALLPNTRLSVSPRGALQQYRRAVSLLTILLYAFSVPILTLILIFINLVVGLAVGRKHNEIAVLRSRGATAIQVVGIALLEGLLLGGIALALGLPLGKMIAEIIGQTRSFLNFTAQADLRVAVTPTTLRIGIIAVGLAVIAQVIPTIGAARHTIVTYKQERARSLRPPWWQRVWLDLLLLIPTAYGTYLLRQQGSIVLPGSDGVFNNGPFQNPLLLLIPALGIIALTLLFLRILPLIMSALAWITSHVGGVGILLATRQLSRTPGFYSGPMLLLVLTLSLSAFTASLAQTLDNHLFDQVYYQIGADMTLDELGESTVSVGFGSSASPGADTEQEEEEGPRWLFLPVSEYLKAPGVQAATRVGKYDVATKLSGGRQEGTFLGVDRVEFSRAAFWRWDFSPSYLGELMNALAIAPDGVLLPRDFMSRYALNPGDTIQVTVTLYGERITMDMTVMGGFDFFPTWYPEDGPLFVGNLNYLFEQAGGQYPYDIWLKTKPGLDYEQLIQDLRALNPRLITWDAALDKIISEQHSPERQGLFGLLSVGFGAAALLTVLGFLLYALFSFRQRFIELGVLRAIGLSSGQMAIFLAWELAFLILTGLILGTGLGTWVSQLFIPFLQVGAEAEARIPPFLVEIAWPAIFRIYALFGLLFVVALLVLTGLLLRMKIFEAVKLGETV